MDRKWWTLVAVCTGVFMLLLDVTIVNVALPDIQKSLGASLSDLQWVVDAYALSLAALLLTTAFHGRERGTAFGIFGAVTGVAVAVGPVLGGAITSGLSWRWIFFVNIPIGAFALAVTLMKVRESRAPVARRPD